MILQKDKKINKTYNKIDNTVDIIGAKNIENKTDNEYNKEINNNIESINKYTEYKYNAENNKYLTNYEIIQMKKNKITKMDTLITQYMNPQQGYEILIDTQTLHRPNNVIKI